MKPFRLLILLFLLPFIFASTPVEESDQYCNSRFDYCVEFYQDIFTERTLSANGDGAFFSSPNGEITMTINGEYDILGRSVKEQFELFLAPISTPQNAVIDHTTIFGENHFTSLIELEQGQQVYIQSHKSGNKYINIMVNINDKSFIEADQISESINLVVTI